MSCHAASHGPHSYKSQFVNLLSPCSNIQHYAVLRDPLPRFADRQSSSSLGRLLTSHSYKPNFCRVKSQALQLYYTQLTALNNAYWLGWLVKKAELIPKAQPTVAAANGRTAKLLLKFPLPQASYWFGARRSAVRRVAALTSWCDTDGFLLGAPSISLGVVSLSSPKAIQKGYPPQHPAGTSGQCHIFQHPSVRMGGQT